MVPICESFLRFVLPPGSRHHEDVNPGETGVDFEIATNPPIWLEVKNWEAPVIPPEVRDVVSRNVLNKTDTTSDFWEKLARKFEGTHDCLMRLGERPSKVRLAVLLESSFLDGDALGPMLTVLEERIAGSAKVSTCPVGLFTREQFTGFVPECTAEVCSVSPTPKGTCMTPVLRCAALRRRHDLQVATDSA